MMRRSYEGGFAMLTTKRAFRTSLLPLAVAVASLASPAAAQGTMVPEGAPAQPASSQAAPAQATPAPAQAAPAPAQAARPAPAASTQPAPSAQPAPTAQPETTTTTITTEGSPTIQENQAPVFVAPPVPAVSPQGQWVYTETYGWIWVPEGTTSVIVHEQPYVYLYTPAYGWTWYGSPWGRGVFYVGPWVHHGYGAPRVWHRGGWYAPHVVVRPRVVAPSVVHRGGAPHGGGGHRGHR
jgi:hypothetical protein